MNKTAASPRIIFGELFEALHRAEVLTDGKQISDAIPKTNPDDILKAYRLSKNKPYFSIAIFFNEHFQVQESPSSDFKSDTSKSVIDHIELLWEVLQRKADVLVEGSSLIPLPKAYIVPGGRFNEIYYWDSYFTMLGLAESKRYDLIESMLDNFAYLIDEFGFIPNGNRTYFCSRSQPPFFSLMMKLLAEEKGSNVYTNYEEQLKAEYKFWMDGIQDISEKNTSVKHVVNLDGDVLNRYFDSQASPRAEMFYTDEKDSAESKQRKETYYASVRAACESGWDFSSRWLDESMNLHSIHTSDIIPVDLNCLLYHLELSLIKTAQNEKEVLKFSEAAEKRRQLIRKVFWSEEEAFFFDYNFIKKKLCPVKSLAAVYPLYFKIANPSQAKAVAACLESEFLKEGGLISTTITSGQQWDAPNGWAPLQWMSIVGLRNYGYHELADEIKTAWTRLNIKVYQNTGKLLEKYNVVDTNLESGGGEYPVQDGFGWTNGVLLKLLKEDQL